MQSEKNLFEGLLVLGKLLGMSRSVALVFALLHSGESRWTAEDIMDVTGLSKSAVSMALRDLIQMGTAQETIALGERSRYYTGHPDLVQSVTDIFMAKIGHSLVEFREKIEHASGPQVRLDQAQALLARMNDVLADIRIRG